MTPTLPRAQRLSSEAGRLTLALLILTVFGYLSRYAVELFLAQELKGALFSDYVVAIRVISLGSVFVLIGTSVAMRRFLPLYHKRNESSSVGSYLRWNGRLLLRTTVMAVVAALAALALIGLLHINNIKPYDSYHLATYALFIAPLLALVLAGQAILLSYHHPLIASTMKSTLRWLVTGAVLWVLLVALDLESTPVTIAWGLFGAMSILLLIFVIVIHRKISGLIHQVLNQTHAQHPQQAQWRSTALQMTFSSVIYEVLSAADVFALEILDPNSAAVVGHYGAALTITCVLTMIPISVYSFVQPRISTLLETSAGRMEFEKLNTVVLIFILLITSSAALIIIGFSDPLLGHFGPGFVAMRSTLWILAATGVIASARMGSISYLMYAGYQSIVLRLNLLQLAVTLISCVLFIPYWGPNGAALAMLIGSTINCGAAAVLARRLSGLRLLVVV